MRHIQISGAPESPEPGNASHATKHIFAFEFTIACCRIFRSLSNWPKMLRKSIGWRNAIISNISTDRHRWSKFMKGRKTKCSNNFNQYAHKHAHLYNTNHNVNYSDVLSRSSLWPEKWNISNSVRSFHLIGRRMR